MISATHRSRPATARSSVTLPHDHAQTNALRSVCQAGAVGGFSTHHQG